MGESRAHSGGHSGFSWGVLDRLETGKLTRAHPWAGGGWDQRGGSLETLDPKAQRVASYCSLIGCTCWGKVHVEIGVRNPPLS